ncbi:MAG: gamma-glutamyltranspeptidase/glutathione hydrolase [Hyphomicrobiaceae bacterium]|jgi:gamma-glutamyltranspeptidase/glutathione hydrolase
MKSTAAGAPRLAESDTIMRSLHFPGRSPVYARKAMCATSHPLASQTALSVLKDGGNAVDAAIAATAVLCVVEHAMTGIGGDCFAIVSKPGEKPFALNASGRAPAALTAEYLLGQGINAIEQQSPHSVTIPGAVDGWATLLADHGTRQLKDLLQPAIAYASEGFAIAPRVGTDWAGAVAKLSANANAAKHFLVDGKAPAVGDMMRFPNLAKSLEAIAEGGRDAYYEGDIAADIVKELNALGGVHTLEDFAAQRAEYVEPISVNYRGLDVLELPPNNHGVVVLIMLKMMDRLGKLSDSPDSAERYHVMLEVARLAYAMRDEFVADPDMADVPVDHMLDDQVIAELVSRVDRRTARPDLGPNPQPKGSDTVYLSIVDEGGMAVSFINSLFADFGSGIATDETGIILQNRGQGFVVQPGHRNCVAPRKRPLHTLIPALAMRNGELAMSFGVMGGAYQPAGHAHVLANILDYGMDPQEALDSQRVFFDGDKVLVEATASTEFRAGLAAKGHDVGQRGLPWGGGQIIQVDGANGTLIGGSDARKDGCALGF